MSSALELCQGVARLEVVLDHAPEVILGKHTSPARRHVLATGALPAQRRQPGRG
jgi:hypothetical protein